MSGEVAVRCDCCASVTELFSSAHLRFVARYAHIHTDKHKKTYYIYYSTILQKKTGKKHSALKRYTLLSLSKLIQLSS